MINYHTGGDVAAEIHMIRTKFVGAVLIVEGEMDERVLCCFVEEGDCRIVPAYGKENALAAIALLESNAVRGVLAIVDADFCRLSDDCPSSPNVLATDDHDLDLMIFMSKALDRVIAEYGSKGKTRTFLKTVENQDLRQAILGICEPIGALRWISTRDGLGLKFKELNFKTFVKSASLEIDVEKLIAAVLRRSTSPVPTVDGLREEIALCRGRHSLRQLCNGKRCHANSCDRATEDHRFT